MAKAIYQNNFGALRLLFAGLVILSHCPEQLDVNQSRELLHRVFGTVDFGDLAVDGFFLISGYLITMSYYQLNSIKHFFVRRCLRIFPGFAVASLVSIFVFVPISGGWELISNFSLAEWAKIPFRIFTLKQPWVEGAFQSTKDPSIFYRLNSPMWTIQMELICYFTVPLFAFLGLHHKKRFLMVTALTMAVYFYFIVLRVHYHQEVSFFTFNLARLLTAFFVGAGIYLFKDIIVWNQKIAIACAILLLLVFSNRYLAEPALMLLGGYLLFNFALNFKNPLFNAIGTKTDLSYGVYLYAWPIQMVIMMRYPDISPWVLSAYVFAIATMCAFVSWNLVEKPFMQMKKYYK